MPNLKAKYIIDENGDRVAPITYIDAVRNSSGDSLSDLMVPENLGFGIGTCSTSSGTALTVALLGYKLVKNGYVTITFENDVPASSTLNINSLGAKAIYYKGAAIESGVIKADDTITFCYDGTNYEVISLGGDGAEDGEIVVVRCSANNDASVAGQTITINGTQYTLDATGVVSAKVPFGTQYSVAAGSWTDHITPTTQSFTASLVLREVSIEWEFDDNTVDLGLPSGVRWAKKNIDVTQSNKFTASEFQYECSFFSWGNVAEHNPISDSAFSYDFGASTSGPYASTTGAALTGNIPTNATYDAARAICGDTWRLATGTEWQELIDNCDFVQADGVTIISGNNKLVTINGIIGTYLKSKINGNLLFLPCCGFGRNTNWERRGTHGYYWSSSINTDYVDRGQMVFFNSDVAINKVSDFRFYGYPCRPVK